MHISLAIAVTLGFATQLAAQSPAPLPPVNATGTRDPATTAIAHRVTRAPEIDGLNNDDIWATAPKIDGFKQFEPNDGSDPSFRTEFQVGYDERNLFVFIRAYDPHPDSIRHALTRRDIRGPSDQLKLIIDSFNDNRTGFEFAVNPDGVKRDFAVYDDGNEDDSWNGVWDVETQASSAFLCRSCGMRGRMRTRSVLACGVTSSATRSGSAGLATSAPRTGSCHRWVTWTASVASGRRMRWS
jgi:hypothetical protein